RPDERLLPPRRGAAGRPPQAIRQPRRSVAMAGVASKTAHSNHPGFTLTKPSRRRTLVPGGARMKAAIVVGALVLALPLMAVADEVYLRSGGHLSGVGIERRAEAIVVDVGPGRVTFPASLVTRVVEGTPAFALFRERAARLSDADVHGWLALGAWARD